MRYKEIAMFLKKRKGQTASYDQKTQKPVIKCSICNGEQVAGFKDLGTGIFTDIMLIVSDDDLRDFKEKYGITGDIERIY